MSQYVKVNSRYLCDSTIALFVRRERSKESTTGEIPPTAPTRSPPLRAPTAWLAAWGPDLEGEAGWDRCLTRGEVGPVLWAGRDWTRATRWTLWRPSTARWWGPRCTNRTWRGTTATTSTAATTGPRPGPAAVAAATPTGREGWAWTVVKGDRGRVRARPATPAPWPERTARQPSATAPVRTPSQARPGPTLGWDITGPQIWGPGNPRAGRRATTTEELLSPRRTLPRSRGKPTRPRAGTTAGPYLPPTGGRTGERQLCSISQPTYSSGLCSRSRLGDPSPSRHSYHDSAYSSHSSQSSDNPPASAFSVIQHQQSPPAPALARPALSTQSSPSKVSVGSIISQTLHH